MQGITLNTLNTFLKELNEKGIDIPKGLEVTITDYPVVVPEEFKHQSSIEYNTKYGEGQKVHILNWSKINRKNGIE